jgi:hypothetical protein
MGFFDWMSGILPKSFLNGSLLNWTGLYKASARQLDDLKTVILSSQDELFIDSANTMLPVYEAEFAIQLIDQSNIAARRNNVMAMSRGGIGATPAAIQGVLQSYGYATNIVENYAGYTVTIQFTDTRGIPPNINDLKALMTRFIPGHLQLLWQYIYTQYRELNGNYTYAQFTGHTYDYYKTQLPS